MKFKLNDWVRDVIEFNNIHQILTEQQLDIVNGAYSRVVLWKPQPNEWCWFYDSDKQPQLGKSTGVTPDSEDCDFFIGNVTYPFNISHLIEGFNCCEPFIGELPTILKNQ